MAEDEILQIDPSKLTGIRCTLADLQLVQTVLIDITVSVSRDYGILTTGICEDVSMDMADQFGCTVQELKNLVMQLKHNTGWVTVKETSRHTAKSKSAARRERRKRKLTSQSSDENLDTSSYSRVEGEGNCNTPGDEGWTGEGHSDDGISINQQVSESFMMTCDDDQEENVYTPLQLGTDNSITADNNQAFTIKKELPDDDDIVEVKNEDNWESGDNNDLGNSELPHHISQSYPSLYQGPSHTMTLSTLQQQQQQYLQQQSKDDTTPEDYPQLGFVYKQPTLSPKEQTPKEETRAFCDLCKRLFTSEDDLAIHYCKALEQRKTIGYTCKYCDQVFGAKQNLITHVKTHTGETPFRCDRCYKCFTRKYHLEVHRKIHTGEKFGYACYICGKLCSSTTNLAAHVRVHTGEKPFKCDECSKCYKRKAHLVIHSRSHTGERPFKCETCGKGFSRKFTLLTHMRLHTGEKPFKCEKCDKRFNNKGDLYRHVKHPGGCDKKKQKQE